MPQHSDLPGKDANPKTAESGWNLGVIYSESESAGLTRRATRIAQERGWPLPIARSDAKAQRTRSQTSGHCALVVNLGRTAADSVTDSPAADVLG